ncbi:MAG: VanW family protein [Candidatus Tumulicola sp.]
MYLALRRLDGAVVPAGSTFSFWRQIGRATRRAGYVEGRELREGCIIPTVGGGLCQLSNALYAAALDSDCEIVERHAHSHFVPGSMTERDRDATVFWNYVDLRFSARHELTIRCRLQDDRLIVQFFAPVTAAVSQPLRSVVDVAIAAAPPSCISCDRVACTRHRKIHGANSAQAAFLLDGYWPEYDAFIATQATTSDLAFVPIDGKRFNLPQYAWALAGFGGVKQAPLETLVRAGRSRRLASHGAARQRAMLLDAERLAHRFARHLPSRIEHVVVMQNLLPYLWRTGYLAGCTFDVLMTSLPMNTLHEVLDDAARRHPDSPTLSDFRAPRGIVKAEREALDSARRVVTPHRDIARRFGARALLLPWVDPTVPSYRAPTSNRVLFAGATLGRSGAYEIREAARRTDSSIVVIGDRDAEGPDFWRGLDVTRVANFRQGLDLARIVALPAFVEHRPRQLLHALAAGARVIATTACGLAPAINLTIVPAGNSDALTKAFSNEIKWPKGLSAPS